VLSLGRLLSGVVWIFLTAIVAGRGDAQAPEGLKIPGFTYRLDLRTAADNPDRLGLDFDFRYETARAPSDPRGLHYGLKVGAEGFQTFDRDVTDVNAMAAEIGLTGYYYRTAQEGRVPPELIVRYLELSDRDTEALTDEEIAELSAIQARFTDKRWYGTFDLHYRYETDQTITDDEHAFGAGIAAEVPLLANLLDLVPAMTRRAVTGDVVPKKAQPVRAFVGLDRVTGADETALGEISGEGSFWRARLEAAWATRILQGFVLRTTFESSVILDGNSALEGSGRDVTSFFAAWLLYPLSQKTNLMVKYLSGRLPPNYDEATVGKVGLSIALQ
jgi:hypothetical protein